ncbi:MULTISPECIES: type V toxin-antitoxin system endoribonuclease antitoxin GhoS [unclassified Buttiauxella]|uniref:type V toxin-antitoxin system endoribonuclease antitoxin GhoS n=1 Tax=unclassified Buttiauxella TaxID=2634062 RepID=UPI001E2933DA|nr:MULTISPECIES: type V toxin-antitoxin system endoribonuclease antitoxin GhoS [unclassified Buttiauxella]MCE0799596.1 type V toxin-antitoxin system endoribonuclease antitoxin GhoS [Buttiauxella sp. W03-F01]MCE0812907.1 type V toxin-antitoxin system endoribonuclease antitoxin GhoS [Buttiauxella sp. S04-F03]
MSSGDIVRYVVTFKFQENNLTDLNELNNQLTRGGFLLTMSDDEGKIHELGINTFGLISTSSQAEVEELSRGLGQLALGIEPEVSVTTWENWLQESK